MVSQSNLLLACFPEVVEGQVQISRYDWSARDVEIPYVIFFTGRCGSTLLTHLLGDTGLCGFPAEFFNEAIVEYTTKTLGSPSFLDYIESIVRNHTSNHRFGFEIDSMRFDWLVKIIEFSGVFDPDITKFFWLTRRDIVAQAWSYAEAKRSGLWHLFADGTDAFVPRQGAAAGWRPTGDAAPVDHHAWWQEIMQLVCSEQKMERFFRRAGIAPLRLDYEGLVADKHHTIIRALRHLRCSSEAIAECLPKMSEYTKRQSYPRRDAQLLNFLACFEPEIHELETRRGELDVAEFGARLSTRQGISPAR